MRMGWMGEKQKQARGPNQVKIPPLYARAFTDPKCRACLFTN